MGDFFLAVTAITGAFSCVTANICRNFGVMYIPDIHVDAAIALLLCGNGKWCWIQCAI